MKIAVLGIADFPLGKKNLIDSRLKVLEGIIKPSKTTYIAIEFLDSSVVKDAEGIICEKEAKLDLIIQDLESVENRLLRLKEGEDSKLFLRVKEILEQNKFLCEENFNDEDKKLLFNSNFLTVKPAYFVDAKEDKPILKIMFEAYYALGMSCFFTGAKDKELRAWLIKKDATALDAAGAIHSDIQRGFIKAEIIAYEDAVKSGSLNLAKQYLRLEGKEYIVQDGDIITFRFNV